MKKRKNELQEIADAILEKCMCVKENERVLILTDKNKLKIAYVLLKAADKFTRKTKLLEMPVAKVNGQEPPDNVVKEMKEFDIILMPTTRSLTHTKATKEAGKAGVRIASMPGITMEMMQRCITPDYSLMDKLNKKLYNVLIHTETIIIKTKLGTDIKFNIGGREIKVDKNIIKGRGMIGNLPAGEVFVAPRERTANGIIIADASIGGIGKVDEPVRITVEGGKANDIKGGIAAAKLKRMLKPFGYPGRNIAEFGLGTNEKAQITGLVLEDEKVLGTVHIALGNNKNFGGEVSVPIHLDCVITKPTIFADARVIMEEGKFLV